MEAGPNTPRRRSISTVAEAGASFWNRDELFLVTRYFGESTLFPVAPRLFKTLFGARDEVPVKVPVAIERRAAEKHQPAMRCRMNDDVRVTRENNHRACRGTFVSALHLTVDDICRSLRIFLWNRQRRTSRQTNIEEKQRRKRVNRRALAVGRS